MVIGYYMVTIIDMMVQLVLIANSKRKVIEWDNDIVPMKDPETS